MRKFKDKICDICGNIIVPTGANQKRCKTCGRAHDRLWENKRSYRRHGVTKAQFQSLFTLGCALCHIPFASSPHVDHDHSHCPGRFGCEKCFRGLLCKFCNNGFIYAIESNPELRKFVSPEVLEYIDKLHQT
jgi:hypothetical protein